MTVAKGPGIAFVIDDRVSREKIAILTRAINALRHYFSVELIKGHETSEEKLLSRIQAQGFPLVVAPLHRYSAWARIEGHLGIHRTGGPTFAGYFCEPIPFFQALEAPSPQRRIILDFTNLTPPELLVLIRSLIQEKARMGLKPLLEASTPIYCESWYGKQGQGSRIDHVLALPEIAGTAWNKRSSSIRILLSALWSLIYEEGPGKVDVPAGTQAPPKAYFQLGADATCLCLRLYYYNIPRYTIKEALQQFQADRTAPTAAAQLLLKYADFVRVHTLAETSDIEVVVGLFHSAPSEKAPEEAHTVWIEPISARLMEEPPYEAPSPKNPQLKALPTVSLSLSKPRAVTGGNSSGDSAKDRLLLDAKSKIIELKEKVDTQTDTIRELRSGGVGTAKALPPPDIESLLDGFQQRYFEARYQIREFELQIVDIEKRGATPEQVKTLRLKMEALMNREKAWIKKIMDILALFKGAARKPKI